ncbi:MAG: radical SAM protein [Desulfobaccales bacterium]
MKNFTRKQVAFSIPRLPLDGSIDLTYRCNNTCRHCWLWLPPDAPQEKDELAFEEIRRIADEARAMGCRSWHISGGEPMLRPDFAEILDYLSSRAASYSLNTNGTLITPAIAQLLNRKGSKMIALYGATPEVYDAVTRHPGGFEEMMRGIAYLREAGAGFKMSLIPMRANWHQWDQMVALAKSLSPQYKVGAPWLFLSSDGSVRRNREIAALRLAARDVIEVDKPNPTGEERLAEISVVKVAQNVCGMTADGDDRLFASCIAIRRDFHIDSYGKMSFCSFIKDPGLRYDLRQGAFREAWDEFIPSLADKVHGGEEYRENCGACERRGDCRWCAVYSYLETGRYSAPVPYLCAVAREGGKFKEEWQEKHRRYFRFAGITVRLESELDFGQFEFEKKLVPFAVAGPGEDNVTLQHFFFLPDLKGKDLGEEVYRKPPWAISRKDGTWFYRGIDPDGIDDKLGRVAVFDAGHTHGTIYSRPSEAERLRTEGWYSLSLFATDQIWMAPLLADRQAVLLHSAAVIVNGQGLIFVGHSTAGKSTTVTMLKKAARAPGESLELEILCDDRNIVRRWDEGWRVHGAWSHGTVPEVSPASAPLAAILFLHQDSHNAISPLRGRIEIWKRLLATLIKPMVTAEWWRKELDVLERLINEVPCYQMDFDKSGAIVAELARLVQGVPPCSPVVRPSPEVL